MTQEQDQTLQAKLDSYNDVRDFWSFANPGARFSKRRKTGCNLKPD